MGDNRRKHTQDLTRYLFWIFLLQGLAYIILGVLIFIYPAVLFILVAVNFIWIGITTLLLAFRVRAFHNLIPEMFG